jgi:hypothetical protein
MCQQTNIRFDIHTVRQTNKHTVAVAVRAPDGQERSCAGAAEGLLVVDVVVVAAAAAAAAAVNPPPPVCVCV